MKKVTCIVIENEFEGDSPLWLDLDDPNQVAYIKDNIERDQKREFTIKEISQEEFDEIIRNSDL